MGMSSQRLLILVLAINLVISLSFAIYESPDNFSFDTLDETINLGSYTATQTEGETSSVSPENLQEEGTWGSALGMGTTITKLFFRGLVSMPYSTTDDFNDPINKLFAKTIILFRVLFGILLALEIFFIFKNRKNT